VVRDEGVVWQCHRLQDAIAAAAGSDGVCVSGGRHG
jgi:hypothetical protein